MQDYIIMTDSCCDLTDQMARELELEVLPLTMTMDGKEYPNTLDGRYITNEEFYKRLRAGKTSTTAAANVGQFEDAMRTVLGRGQDILCLCFSSALSTTYQSAVIAAENLAPDFPERTIRVIDTLSAFTGRKMTGDDVVALGKSVLKQEREFNAAAGFTRAHDRLPMYMRRELLPPHNTTFDVSDEELDSVFNF